MAHGCGVRQRPIEEERSAKVPSEQLGQTAAHPHQFKYRNHIVHFILSVLYYLLINPKNHQLTIKSSTSLTHYPEQGITAYGVSRKCLKNQGQPCNPRPAAVST